MAHFAEIDRFGNVLRVIVVDNEKITDEYGKESEEAGIVYCQKLAGAETIWLQTSYNGNFRKNYATEGCRYDKNMDAFIPPQPFSSWNLNTETCQWDPPKPVPDANRLYTWNESLLRWVALS